MIRISLKRQEYVLKLCKMSSVATGTDFSDYVTGMPVAAVVPGSFSTKKRTHFCNQFREIIKRLSIDPSIDQSIAQCINQSLKYIKLIARSQKITLVTGV